MAAVAVLGGGVAGLAAALHLARSGHRVVVVERDRLDVGSPEDAPGWERRGIAHFLQPHAFIPGGRVELRDHLPDVYEALLAAGAHDVDVRSKLPGEAAAVAGGPAGDEDLQYFAVRRPVIEWALRRAVGQDGRIDVRAGTTVAGLRVDDGRVVGVRVDGGSGVLDADLVVDALGRRTPSDTWLADAGMASEPRDTSDCGVVYYSRYYRVRPGLDLPDGPWVLSPRGDLGYMAYASFPGDNGTFAGLLSVPTGVREWRAFGDPAVFEAVVARIPALRSWADPERADPLTGVLPMAGLRNTLRHYDPASTPGLVPMGDAYSHTDPVLAHGLAFALVHARALATALAEHGDGGDALAAYAAATGPALRERYELATALDEQRLRMWTGERVDVTRADGGAYALFSVAAGGAVALVDPDVFRVFVRRMGLLDSTAVLDGDAAMQRRIEQRFAELLATPRPPAGPSRDEVSEIVQRAAGRAPAAD